MRPRQTPIPIYGKRRIKRGRRGKEKGGACYQPSNKNQREIKENAVHGIQKCIYGLPFRALVKVVGQPSSPQRMRPYRANLSKQRSKQAGLPATMISHPPGNNSEKRIPKHRGNQWCRSQQHRTAFLPARKEKKAYMPDSIAQTRKPDCRACGNCLSIPI